MEGDASVSAVVGFARFVGSLDISCSLFENNGVTFLLSMQLTDEQKTKVAEWIAEGLRLSEIQERLGKEFDVRLTYMDARILVDDLKLLPKDPVEPVEQKPVEEPVDAPAHDAVGAHGTEVPERAGEGAGQVSVTSDTLARPGAIASGKINFSDGQQATWFLDQMGQMRMMGPNPGYRPPEADMPLINQLMEREFQRLGL